MDLSEEIAWLGNMLHFGDILNMDGPLVEIGPRSFFANLVVGDGSSQRGRVCARPDPAGGAWSERRGAWSVGRGAWGGRKKSEGGARIAAIRRQTVASDREEMDAAVYGKVSKRSQNLEDVRQ